MIEKAGFTYDPPDVLPNSMRSLELAEFARDSGQFSQLHRRLFSAYWSEHLDIGDAAVLEDIATAVGLDAGEVRQMFGDGTYRDRIAFTTQSALDLGVNGVPAWLVDDRLLISGAQPHEAFNDAMVQLGHKPDERGSGTSQDP